MPGRLQKMWVVDCGHIHHNFNRDEAHPEGVPDFTAKASEMKQRDVYGKLEAEGWEIDPKEGVICKKCATTCGEAACPRAHAKAAT